MWSLFFHQRAKEFLKRPCIELASFLRQSGWIVAIHGLLILLLGVYAYNQTGLRERLESLGTRAIHGGTMHSDRLPLLRTGLEILEGRFLFGLGPGRYDDQVRAHFRDSSNETETRDVKFARKYLPIHSHNLYLQLALELGVFGLLGFLYLLSRVLFRCVRRYRSNPLGFAGLSLILAFLIHNVFDVTFPSLALEMGLLLGAALSAERNRSHG
jgi:O-antigen ligase